MAKPLQTDKIYCMAANNKHSTQGITNTNISASGGWFKWTGTTDTSYVRIYQSGSSLTVISTLLTLTTSGHYSCTITSQHISRRYKLGLLGIAGVSYVLYNMSGLTATNHTLSFDYDKTNKKFSNIIMVEGSTEGNYIDTRSAIACGADLSGVTWDQNFQAPLYYTSDGLGHYQSKNSSGTITNRTCQLRNNPTLTYANNQAIRWVDINGVVCGING